jgi:predicted component of type VI protein secretion system
MPYLSVYQKGKLVDRKVVVGKIFFIGREPNLDLVLDAGDISRRHCRLIIRDGKYWLHDLGSTHGVYVDGRRVFNEPLNHGARIQLGSYLVRYEDTPEVPLETQDVGANTDWDILTEMETQPLGIQETGVVSLGSRPVERRNVLLQTAPHLYRLRPAPEAVIPLRVGASMVGTSSACQLREEAVGKKQAAVIIRDSNDKVRVERMGRRSNISLNGLSVDEAHLADGDRLKIGRALFVFRRGG